MEKNLNTILRAAADFLFPSSCLACGRRPVERFLRGGVCEACWNALPPREQARCDTCDEALTPSVEATRCGRCALSPPPFRRLQAAAPYRGCAREILIAFKFAGADYLAPHLAKLMTDRLGAPADIAEVTAVPATSRARRHGDHAADLLGAAVAARLGVRFTPSRLAKVRSRERQSGLPLSRRADNVAGAFRARAGAPRRILLADDVATSGATARECARLLLKAGAREVDVWCFARASRDDRIADELADHRISSMSGLPR